VARNGAAQTVVPPYAPRPRPGAPVATPLRWEELDDDGLRPDAWTLRTVLHRVEQLGGDPWAGIAKAAKALPRD
jgi:bifunctional non-homologous end joining protein LigD